MFGIAVFWIPVSRECRIAGSPLWGISVLGGLRLLGCPRFGDPRCWGLAIWGGVSFGDVSGWREFRSSRAPTIYDFRLVAPR